MQKALLCLACLFLFFSAAACQGGQTVGPEPYSSTTYSNLILDQNGDPIPCAGDQDCDGYVDKDQCVYGVVCHNNFCAALIYDTCCESDGNEITCSGFTACGNDEECDDEEVCTEDACNPYLFGGVCTHSPANLGATYCGVGACQNSVPVCKDGELNNEQCQPLASVDEFCNNLDDDCDSATDEGDNGCGGVCPLDPGPGDACDGSDTDACEDDVYVCDGANAVACSAGEENVEECNQIDDDCDGEIDEGTNACGGVCLLGNEPDDVCDSEADTDFCFDDAYACNGLNAVTCVWGGDEDTETCNGLDDDCDQSVDEDWPELGDICWVGVGECQDFDFMVCNQSGDGTTCAAVAGQSSPEICDGLDNDCDQVVDEELGQTTCGVGICVHTVDNCVNGVPQQCNQFEGAVAETCNDLDDDCDGAADDNLGQTTCGQGVCDHTIDNCVNGVSQQCDPLAGAGEESCNGLDDDCDGETDEGNPEGGSDCGQTDVGECELGEWVCTGGSLQCIGALDPVSESCNGLDDDCDGAADEGWPVGESCDGGDSDLCENGTYTCTVGGSGVECINEVPEGFPGYEESCNGLDDDCDGETDEGNPEGGSDCGQTDVGECELGEWVCVNGALTCAGAVDPDTELCDGLDNDCDNATDEGLACSTCNNPSSDLSCWGLYPGATNGDNWLDAYSCKPTLDESGSEAVFVFNNSLGGLSVKAKVVSIDPVGANLDIFVLDSCEPAGCFKYGITNPNASATWDAEVDIEYYVVVDGFANASGSFDLQITCKETACNDGLDNDDDDDTDCWDSDCACVVENCVNGVDDDADGKVDCDDSDCKFDAVCLPTCQPLDDIVCGESKVGTTVGGANLMSGYDCTSFDESGPEAVFQFTAPFTGSVTASVTSNSTDLDVVVLENICMANQCLAFGNYDATFDMVGGQTYYIVADGFSGNQGDYTLSLTCAP